MSSPEERAAALTVAHQALHEAVPFSKFCAKRLSDRAVDELSLEELEPLFEEYALQVVSLQEALLRARRDAPRTPSSIRFSSDKGSA